MSLLATNLLLALAANLGIAAFVFVTNRTRIQNRLLSVFAIVLACWCLGVLIIITSVNANVAELSIRFVTYASIWIPITFQMLCHSIAYDKNRFSEILRSVAKHLILGQLFGLAIFTDTFVSGVHMPGDPGIDALVPVPIRGPAFGVVHAYILIALFFIIGMYLRRLGQLRGVKRAELQFTLLGVATGAAIASVTQLLLPITAPELGTEKFGPLCTIPINLIIAYGIATRRVMDVPTFLQRAAAYGLLTLYLSALYTAVFFGVNFAALALTAQTTSLAHLIAALAIAFAMSPMHGVLQRFSRKLFITSEGLAIRELVAKGRNEFSTIRNIEEMSSTFVSLLEKAGLDPEYISVYLPQADALDCRYSTDPAGGNLPLPLNSPMIEYLRAERRPVSLDSIKRLRPNQLLSKAAAELSNRNISLVYGLFFKNSLEGVVLCGPRLSGKIYNDQDQDIFELLSDQMANGLHNNQLYTEAQNSKIYNDILLDNLVSGVIAVDRDGTISVANREALRLTGLSSKAAVGAHYRSLPASLAELFQKAVENADCVRDLEIRISLQTDDVSAPVRASSTRFRDVSGEVLGALIVFHDLTTLKALQDQVRHHDRLASIGTLAAGMAHEIKNPLVTIKTFTQLLPERFHDKDFRDTFSELISQEVTRIDSIVNQLLHFSRPVAPYLKPTSLHELLKQEFRLIQEQLRQHEQDLVADLRADKCIIRADSDLLDQAFINFFLNAVQAMEKGGVLKVSTSLVTPDGLLQKELGSRDEHLCLVIEDNGKGMDEEVLANIFDPFYTTKEDGTGLGLSVAHGIITDHSAVIRVSSAPGDGTRFTMYFPIFEEEPVLS